MAPLSTAEAAALIEIDRSTLSRWVKEGRIEPLYRLSTNGQMVFDPKVVKKLAGEVAKAKQQRAAS